MNSSKVDFKYIAGNLPLIRGENRIALMFGCDDLFLPHCLAAIASILSNANQNDWYDIWIMHGGLKNESVQLSENWIARWPFARLRFMDLSETIAKTSFDYTTPNHLSAATYYRIFAPEVFTSYDRMLYLDCDVIAADNIAPLFHADLSGNMIGVCHDPILEAGARTNPEVAEYWRSELGLNPETDSYFNAGVLLMDLASMRKNDMQSKMMQQMSRVANFRLLDQDLLNIVFKQNAMYLDRRWNLFDFFLDPQPRTASLIDIFDMFSSDLKESRNNPGIIHFVHHKPWRKNYLGTNADCYWRHALMTPFGDATRTELQAEVSSHSIVFTNILWILQSWNYKIRKIFSSKTNRKKYEERIYNLLMRRKNILRHMRNIISLGAR